MYVNLLFVGASALLDEWKVVICELMWSYLSLRAFHLNVKNVF